MAAMTRQQTVALARRFLGVAESPPRSNRVRFSEWYGMIGAWCAMFVSYVLYYSGNPLPIRTSKGFAFVPDVVQWAKKNGRWTTDRRKAKPGDLTVFWFPGGPSRPNHVGIFVGLTWDGRVINVEGNTGSNNRDGGSVQERNRSSGVYGFVLLDYPDDKPSAPKPKPQPKIQESDMIFFFTIEGAARTFMGDGFHYREVSDTDRQMYNLLFKKRTGQDIGSFHLQPEQVKRMTNVGP